MGWNVYGTWDPDPMRPTAPDAGGGMGLMGNYLSGISPQSSNDYGGSQYASTGSPTTANQAFDSYSSANAGLQGTDPAAFNLGRSQAYESAQMAAMTPQQRSEWNAYQQPKSANSNIYDASNPANNGTNGTLQLGGAGPDVNSAAFQQDMYAKELTQAKDPQLWLKQVNPYYQPQPWAGAASAQPQQVMAQPQQTGLLQPFQQTQAYQTAMGGQQANTGGGMDLYGLLQQYLNASTTPGNRYGLTTS